MYLYVTSAGSCYPCSKFVLCNIPVVLFYLRILAVIANIYFGVRICSKILASSSVTLNLLYLIWKIGILMPASQLNLQS